MNIASRIIAALLILCSILVPFSGCTTEAERPLRFTLTFAHAQNLQRGQFVVYNGIRIGEVLMVDLDPAGQAKVEVEIGAQYRNNVYREDTFIIEKPNGLLDMSGERQITVKAASSRQIAVQQADILAGTEGVWDQLKKAAREKADGVVKSVGGAIESAIK